MQYTKHPDGYSWTFLSEPNNDGSQRILGSMRLDPDNAFKETFEYWNSDDTEQKLMYELGIKLKRKVKRRSFYAKHESAFQLPKGKKLLVLCEGKTEKCYLDALCRELFILDEVDVKVSEQKDPGDVIEAVTKQHLWDRLLGCESYSETWLVFDRDGHKGYERALSIGYFFIWMNFCQKAYPLIESVFWEQKWKRSRLRHSPKCASPKKS